MCILEYLRGYVNLDYLVMVDDRDKNNVIMKFVGGESVQLNRQQDSLAIERLREILKSRADQILDRLE